MKTYNNCPIFLLNVEDPNATITTMSLVDCPAMELPMYCFEEDKQLKFSLQEAEHNIISCIVRVDHPILRSTEDGRPYYVLFNRETSTLLCQKLMRDGYQQNISLDHNGELIDGIQLQEVFIKDSAKGINPAGFEAAADGSLFGIYHITDDNLWNACLEGRFGGISLESYFKLEQFKQTKIENKFSTKMSKLRESIKNLLLQFSEVETDKGILTWEEDAQLEVGYSVYMDGQPAPDGEYKVDDKIFVVVDGKVAEMRDMAVPDEEGDKKVEEQMACGDKKKMEEENPDASKLPDAVKEKPEEEKPAEPAADPVKEQMEDIEGRIAAMEEKIKELVEKLAEIAAAPAAAPVAEEFEKATAPKATGNKSLDKRIALAAALREN